MRGGAPALPRAAKGPVLLPRVGLPEVPPTPPEGYTGDSINDALDDLLRQAAASLKHLDGIRAKLPAGSQGPKHQGSMKDRRSDASNFWKPRCRSDLWGEDDDFWDDLDGEADSDSESLDSADVDANEEGLWDFLRAACNAEPAGSSNRSRSTKAAPPNRIFAEARQAKPVPKPSCPTSEAWSHGEERANQGAAERARAHGFRFGTYGSSTSSSGRSSIPGGVGGATSEVQTPEAQISMQLDKAQFQGADAVRATLKRLLLKWHPDKAPQGDSEKDVAARAEATRVLRFVLQERKRLGI